MKAYVVVLIINICNQYYAGGQSQIKQEEILRQKYGAVIFANLLYRHGDRTIIQSYPEDPYKNSSHWDIGLGQLTKEGQARQYRLGQWIKARYPDLVGEKYSYKDIYVTSSDSDRCLMSAQSNLAGMFPVVNTKPPFQPVPIHTLPKEIDNMLYMGAHCALYDVETNNLKTSEYMTDIMSRLNSFYKDLSNFTGNQIKGLDDVAQIYDTLKIEHEDMKLKLPDWALPIYPEPLKGISLESFLSRTHTHTMKRLRGGPLLTDMVRHLETKANGTLEPDRKLWVYSGHDETIVALLNSLNLHGHTITLPSYASLVALELRRREKQHFVTVLYKEGNNDTATELRINGCGDGACSLQQFLDLTKNMTVTNWKKECIVASSTWSTINTFLGLLLLLFPGVIIIYYCMPKIDTRYHKLKNQFL